jgi:hypothetical protein
MTDLHDLTTQLRAWSYRRLYLNRSDTDAFNVLRHLVAVYSSHPSGPLTLHCRTAAMSAETIREWEEQRAAVRIPAMRGSIFLAPIEFAPDLIAATSKPFSGLLASLRYAGMDLADYEALKPSLLDFLREPLPVSVIKRAYPVAERVMTAVRTMADEGLVLRLGSSLRRDDLRYVATESWLGALLAEADRDQAIRWLAETYLRAFGPARIADFAWWSGCTIRQARAAIGDCETVDVGQGYLLPPDLVDAFATVPPLPDGCLTVVPKWDTYTMGYAPDGRQRWIDDGHLIKAFTLLGRPVQSGDALPLVLRGGRAIASWSHRFEGDRMLVTIKPFEHSSLPGNHVFEQIAILFGATRIEVTVATDAV